MSLLPAAIETPSLLEVNFCILDPSYYVRWGLGSRFNKVSSTTRACSRAAPSFILLSGCTTTPAAIYHHKRVYELPERELLNYSQSRLVYPSMYSNEHFTKLWPLASLKDIFIFPKYISSVVEFYAFPRYFVKSFPCESRDRSTFAHKIFFVFFFHFRN